jgi:exopolysaccharide biosynthesis predicted pyruvyltransferase EpsI
MAEINIKEYLKTYVGGEQVYYQPNPGNAGDSLIACATFQIFSDSGLPYRLWEGANFDPADKILFFGGGGSLVFHYDQVAGIIGKIHQKLKKLIILPQTINCHEGLLKALGSNVDIFCRDRVSYEYVKNISLKANVMLADDLAFGLKTQEILTKNSRFLLSAFFSELRYMLKNNQRLRLAPPTFKELKFFLGKEIELFRLPKGDTLHCFREDAEKSGVKLPDDNIDLSGLLKHKKVINRANAFWVCNQFLRFIDSFPKVKTNRLHVAIAAALLNKRVYLYKNSYYKNEAVYKYSMENRFPNVEFMS